MLVLIGDKWLKQIRARLHDDRDVVRFEIETAIERQIRVIPVSVGRRTGLPETKDLPAGIQPLMSQKAMRVREEPDFRSDMGQLIQELARFGLSSTRKTRKREAGR